MLRKKFRFGLRLFNRCPWSGAQELHTYTHEKELDYYVKSISSTDSKRYKSLSWHQHSFLIIFLSGTISRKEKEMD